MRDILAQYNLDQLLLHKVAERPSDDQIAELEYISKLTVDRFKEADVREEIINPILKIVGYRKGNDYSVDREKHIKFVGSKNRYIDYCLTIWEQDFWLIEAKRPTPSQKSFGYKEASQAFEYASHPNIRAALVVLCDGIKLEIFDREENVEVPILSILIQNIVDEYQNLAAYLAPLNVWFFYRRRLIRELDRAFEKEGNLNRVSEFQQVMSRHLDGMRDKVLTNFRANRKMDENSYPHSLKSASPKDVTECHFFVGQSGLAIQFMSDTLLNECRTSSPFHTMYRLFPDEPRDANDFYYMHATDFLIRLESSNIDLHWVPGWLGDRDSEKDKSKILKNLLLLLLSHFENDEPRKIVSLASSAYRRLAKILAVITPGPKMLAELMHKFTRASAPEFSWEQILSSAERNLIFEWENFSILQTSEFVKRNLGDSRRFRVNLAKAELIRLIDTEATILESVPNYQEMLSEANLGEIHPTEYCSVSYDNLGHEVLCVLKSSEKWKAHVLSKHEDLVVELAKLGSRSARECLGEDIRRPSTSNEEHDLACSRFFFSNENLYQRICAGYGRKI
jgi:hypothetical protein